MPDSNPVRVLTVGDRIDPDDIAGSGIEVTAEASLNAASDRLEVDRESIDCLLGEYSPGTGEEWSNLESIRRAYPDLPLVLVNRPADAPDEVLSSDRTTVVEANGSSEPVVEAIRSVTNEEPVEQLGESPMNHLDAISDGFFVLDDEWRFRYINPEGQRLIERDADELIGENIWEEFEAAVDLAFYSETKRAMETQESVRFEEYYPPLDTWFEVHAYPTSDRLAVYFIDISQRKSLERALLAGGGVELEFEIEGDGIQVVEFASRIDGWFRLEGIVPHTGRSGIAYGTVGGTDVGTVMEAAEEMDVIADARQIESHDEGMLFEFTLDDLGFARGLAKHSATLKGLNVTGDGGRMIVTLPHSTDVRDFVETLEANRPGVTLIAQRNDPEVVGRGSNRPLQKALTDRQVEVLEMAFASGYFEWPRKITGEELADSLGIAPPTLHQHLRKGLSHVLETVLASREESDAGG